ncbi:hypothetical protein L596_023220 [Steinernema carpocapsae]|uniref:Integrator complex subunit 11 n=1 Tax=Steinernema carpocapsae TaxID=34508 RepID=A0A4U5MDT1_STECR|nr:hypothetical protein L596_023220 [Steinernema carpocapsae]
MAPPSIKLVCLGAGQDVGRSCILVSIGGKNVMLDSGMHMGYNDDRRFPDFQFISGDSDLNDYLDCVIISHFHLDHCGSLPWLSERIGFKGPIYMTYPTKAIAPVLLEDYRKVQTEFKGDTDFFTSQNIRDCMNKVIPVNLHETVQVDDQLSIRAFYAGHVLGAAMFEVRVGDESILYTGDYNMTPDRHLGAATVQPDLRPDILITESTYATTVRDSKRARERSFLRKVHDCVAAGGKVLIPVFALGRVQELCILLDSYWERMDLKVPIYFSAGLAGRANEYYRMFINWTNEKIKKTFVKRNMFDFKHVLPFEQSYADMEGPQVLFSTPGMLHGGLSLKIFKKWCGNHQNMIIMPGYCVPGTIGAKVINGDKKVEIEGKWYDVNLGVEYMSFSAHADAKGIMQLIRTCKPKNVMFVHGENQKMEFLKEKVEKELGLPVVKPANGETISIETRNGVEIPIPEDLLSRAIMKEINPNKRQCPFDAAVLMDKSRKMDVISIEEAAEKSGMDLHSITFGDFVTVDKVDWQEMADKLLKHDPDLQVKNDGLDLFDGEVLISEVNNEKNKVEVMWDESREEWSKLIIQAIQA